MRRTQSSCHLLPVTFFHTRTDIYAVCGLLSPSTLLQNRSSFQILNLCFPLVCSFRKCRMKYRRQLSVLFFHATRDSSSFISVIYRTCLLLHVNIVAGVSFSLFFQKEGLQALSFCSLFCHQRRVVWRKKTCAHHLLSRKSRGVSLFYCKTFH